MLAERAGVALETPSAGPAPRGPSKTELLAVNAWAERAFAEALARSPEALALSRESGDRPRERRAVPARVRPRGSRLARRPAPGGRVFDAELLEQAGLVVPVARVARADPRAVPGPADLPDPRPPGPDARLRRPDLARGRTNAGRRGEKCRQIPEQPRDGALPEAPDPLCGRPGPPGRPRGGLGRRGRGLHRRDRRAPGGAGQRRRHARHGPGRRPRGRACAGWPIASSWSSTATRRARRRPTAHSSCSWGTRSTSGSDPARRTSTPATSS